MRPGYRPDPAKSISRRRLPRSFKELTPSHHFRPAAFFHEMVWKAWRTQRTGTTKIHHFPPIETNEMALTWIGHASFLIQFAELNALVDPNFANWLFLLKRLKRPGLRPQDLPPIDLLLLTHAHFDHFHKPSLKKVPSPKVAVMPWGCGSLAKRLGFQRIVELKWWESFGSGDWKVTLVPANHWGARTIRDTNRGYGGFVIEHRGRRIYHAGDSAYFEGFSEIGQRLRPEVALLPIGAYYPDSFRKVHMGPDEAIRAFQDLQSEWLVPMHYGTFKLAFENMEEPPQWLQQLADRERLGPRLRILEEGEPARF